MVDKVSRPAARRNAGPGSEAARRGAVTDLLRRAVEDGVGQWPLAGDSMRPLLRAGDRLSIEGAAAAALAVGDLVLFEARGQLVCHRLLRRAPLELAGDHNQRLDRIAPEQVIGRVAAVTTPGGRRLDPRRDAPGLAGPSIARWHRLGRRLLLARPRPVRVAGRLVETARLAALHLLARLWRRGE